MSKIKYTEIYEGHIVAESTRWTCEIDGKERKLCCYIEIINMEEATGEPEFKNYPYLVGFEIMAAKPSKKFYEGNADKPDHISILSDVKSYMGGVPVDHVLLDTDKLNDDLMGQLKAKDAKLVTRKADFGTYAAQNGCGAEFTYPQFKTYEAAETFAKALLERYESAVFGLVGFILDRPINMMGESGWSVIEHHITGKRGA